MPASLLPIILFALLGTNCKSSGTESGTRAQPQNRFVMGPGRNVNYQGGFDLTEAEKNPSYLHSKSWEIAKAVLERVEISDKGLDGLPKDGAHTIPRWITWYDAQEFQNIARIFFAEISHSPGGWRACFQDQNCLNNAIDETFWKNVESVNWHFWTAEYFNRHLAKFNNKNEFNGLGEITKPGTGVIKGITLFSPALVGHYLKNFEAVIRCQPELAPGTANSLQERSCFAKDPPADAYAIKTTWVKKGEKLDTYDTSQKGIKEVLETGNWQSTGTVNSDSLGPDQILTMVSRDLGTQIGEYQLTGMHIGAKLTPDWLWITIWWSQNSKLHQIGEAESKVKKSLGSPWQNYQLCSVSHFQHSDNSSTFCSNPYIETGDGQAKSNCIGCHQHAGRNSYDSINGPKTEPESGRKKRETQFPGDYLWSFSQAPDDFQALLKAEFERSGLR
jgi:hypothetical protein